MTESARPQAWSSPNDYRYRYFIGDNLGQVRLNYADGSTQTFPLILGESVWFGKTFYQSPNPFPTDAGLRSAFASSIHLYPAAPVEDGKYVAMIVPRTTALRSIEIENSPTKKGSVVVSAPANEASFQRLVDSYRPFGFYGEGMGYGQGFVTQAALLLDRMSDATPMLDWTAKEIYDPRHGSFIVPEGVVIDPTGQYWFRTGDLGNGVQEAEIVKALRLVIGVDDTQPQRLRIFPRMPYGWNEIEVEQYPALFTRAGKTDTALVHYRLERSAARMNLNISSDKELGPVTIRVGPFAHRPNSSSVRVNGRSPTGESVQHSGDSWWVTFTKPVGPGTDITQ